jgi:hypothetical protein
LAFLVVIPEGDLLLPFAFVTTAVSSEPKTPVKPPKPANPSPHNEISVAYQLPSKRYTGNSTKKAPENVRGFRI